MRRISAPSLDKLLTLLDGPSTSVVFCVPIFLRLSEDVSARRVAAGFLLVKAERQLDPVDRGTHDLEPRAFLQAMKSIVWGGAHNSRHRGTLDHDLIAADLENALHQLLRRRKFRGAGHIRVSVSREAATATYVVEIELDAAHALAKPLAKELGIPSASDPVVWKINPAEAAAIITAGK